MRIVLRTTDGFSARVTVLKNGVARVAYNDGASVDLGKWDKESNTLHVVVTLRHLLEALYESNPVAYAELIETPEPEPIDTADALVFTISETETYSG